MRPPQLKKPITMPDLLNSLFSSVDKYDYDITKKGFIRKRKDSKSGLKQNELSKGNHRERWHNNGKERGVPSEYGVIHSRNASMEPTRRMEEHRRREPISGINPEHSSRLSHQTGRTSYILYNQDAHHFSTSPRLDKGIHRSEMGRNYQLSTLRSQYHK